MKDFFIQITPLIVVIITAIIFYRFGRNDTRKEAIRSGAAIWRINSITGKKTFLFLRNQNNDILSNLRTNGTLEQIKTDISYVKEQFTIRF